MDGEIAGVEPLSMPGSPFGDEMLREQPEFVFRDYRLKPADRLLTRNGEVVELGGRAFDLLLVLLRSRGSVVSKNDIFAYVWPSMIVDESNLRFQMARLRQALGCDGNVIKTVKGRGYLLAAEGATGFATQGRARSPAFMTSMAREVRVPERSRPASCDGGEIPLIAVIDDDDGTREALEGLLRSTGAQVELFASAAEFMASERRDRVGCIILDVWMPGRSGLEFQEDLCRAELHVPIIFISAHADVQMSVRAMKAGAIEFLTKPVHYQDLLGAIDLALATGRRVN